MALRRERRRHDARLCTRGAGTLERRRRRVGRKMILCTGLMVYLPWGESELAKKQYEVLTSKFDSYDWIPGGRTSAGEVLYIGRTLHRGVLIPGKVHPSHGGLFVAYGGEEHAYQFGYEILVARA